MIHCDRIRVKRQAGPGDHVYVGRTGTFFEYTSNGYARVHLDGEPMDVRVLLHPESLECLENYANEYEKAAKAAREQNAPDAGRED